MIKYKKYILEVDMRLKKILDGVRIISSANFKNYNITSITHSSLDVVDGGMFIAIKGGSYNGNDYIKDAIIKGAKCIISEEDISVDGIVYIRVGNVRKAMSIIAKNFYNKICDTLDIIGVIGSSGKTTTSHIIASILYSIDNNIGIIGTNGIYIGNIRLNNEFTTPDPIDLHYTFYQMKMFGVKRIVMEVSAQAISQYKMYGIRLKVGVFTNISEEHIDFFGSMEKYARVKMDYFDIRNMDEAVINVDDFYGRELAYKSNVPSLSYAINSPANAFALDIGSSLDGLKFTANISDDIYSIDTKFVGMFNVYNILASISACKLMGLSYRDIDRALSRLRGVDGRFEVFELSHGRRVIVDFAHTIHSISELLKLVKDNAGGKVISLLGCVGYSDREKRRSMMAEALNYSDFVIVTTDNRGDTPYEEILNDMVEGVSTDRYISIEDRASAISFGLGMLNKKDILVVMGKGAETYQKIGKEKIKYSDIDTVQQLLESKDKYEI